MWKRIIRGYLNAYALDDTLTLVMWTGRDATQNDISQFAAYINSLGLLKKQPKLIIAQSTKENVFSPYALRQSDCFITTREAICSQAIDFLEGTNIKIVSSLDESIFPGESEYVPKWD